MLMVIVTWSTLNPAIVSTWSGSAKPFVDRQSLMSGAVFAISSNVLNVFSGFASGSPGPAMPSTVICGMVDATASTFLAACSGVSFSLTTPGRDSLAQIVLAIAVVALDVAGWRDRHMHARVVVMGFLAVAGVVLHLLPDLGRQVALPRRRSAARL